MRNVSNGTCTENQNTHCMFNEFFSPKIAPFEIMWENMVKPDKPQMTIQRVRTVCWITKATHTHKHTETCNTYCFYTTAMVSRTRFNVTLYTCTLAVLSLPVMPSWYIRTNTQECWLSNTHQTNFFAEVWAICQVCCHQRSVNRYKGFGATCYCFEAINM